MNTSYTNELPEHVDWTYLCSMLNKIMSRKEIAYYVGVDPSAVSNYTRGKATPKFRIAIKILAVAHDYVRYEDFIQGANFNKVPKIPCAFDICGVVKNLLKSNTSDDIAKELDVSRSLIYKLLKNKKGTQYETGVIFYNYALKHFSESEFNTFVKWHVDELDMAA